MPEEIHPPMNPEDGDDSSWEDVDLLLRARKMIPAIKEFRTITGEGLKEALAAVRRREIFLGLKEPVEVIRTTDKYIYLRGSEGTKWLEINKAYEQAENIID